MLYLIQVTVYTALLYIVYQLALKNRTSHTLSRFYLLTCAVLPVVIPLIKIPDIHNNTIPAPAMSFFLPETIVLSANNGQADQVHWFAIFTAGYMVIALALLIRIVFQHIRFMQFIKQHEKKTIDGIQVLLHTNAGPGSFLNYIFLPAADIDPLIYEHELAHIRQRHSADIICLRILRAIFWPNVVLYSITNELKIVHEFQADAPAAAHKDTYIQVLLNDTFNTNRFALSHTFFYHPLKRRIMMLQKSPLSRTKIRIAIVKCGSSAALIILGIIYLQSCKPQTNQYPQKVNAVKIVYDTINAGAIYGHREVYKMVDKMPDPGYDMAQYLGNNIKYPEAARKAGKEGRVIIRFIVDERGNITEPQVVRSPDTTLTEEALRVVKAMPSWKPGMQAGKNVAVYFTQPISFRLN